MRVRGVLKAAPAIVAAMSLSSCGSGSGGGSDAGGPKVTLLANTLITPWASGTVGFRVSPAIVPGETMLCSIDGAAEKECATSESSGRMAYTDLPMGSHVLTVSMGKSGAMKHANASWEIVAPDVLVYGATPGGITTALAAARAGKKVVLLEPSPYIGGMMAGGLAKTDVGGANVKPLGGITHEFFDRTRDREIDRGACTDSHPCTMFYDFEPHVAGEVFADMLAEQPLISLQRSLPITSATRAGSRIATVSTNRGEVHAKVFVDASYEGDLMVMAGIAHTAEREPLLRAADGAQPGDIEDDAGVGSFVPPYGLPIDPFVVEGDPDSGLLPFVEPTTTPLPPAGSSDDRVMAYNYRLCVTDDPANRVPFERPSDYDPSRYEGSARVAWAHAAAGKPLDELYFNPARTVHSTNPAYYKHDLNGGSAFSTDMSAIDWNQAYSTADRIGRAAIESAYRSYVAGLLYFWKTDPRFGALNAKVARFGLCADEFEDNGHWPYRLYVRETRRMVGEYVMNENDLMRNGRRPAISDGIAMGAYSVDSHIRRITWTHRYFDGMFRPTVVSEGFKIVRLPDYTPYPVAYRSLLPKRGQADNFLNVTTLSASSIAYASLRMEPTFMVIGQAAGMAAAMVVDGGVPVHDVDVEDLRARLRNAGQVLEP